MSIRPMLKERSTLPAGCSTNWRYSTNQIAILATLTSVSEPHHQATGFDQASVLGSAFAKDFDPARHSLLIDHSALVVELTCGVNKNVTRASRSKIRARAVVGRRGSGARRCAVTGAESRQPGAESAHEKRPLK